MYEAYIKIPKPWSSQNFWGCQEGTVPREGRELHAFLLFLAPCTSSPGCSFVSFIRK
jgi:hypothetical protein